MNTSNMNWNKNKLTQRSFAGVVVEYGKETGDSAE